MDMKDRSSRVQAEEARARQELERARDTERAARQAGRVAQEEAAEAKERMRALAEREAAALGEVKAAEVGGQAGTAAHVHAGSLLPRKRVNESRDSAGAHQGGGSRQARRGSVEAGGAAAEGQRGP